MKEADVQQAIKDGLAQVVPQPTPETKEPITTDSLAKFIAVLEVLRRPKYHVTTAPAFTPKTFLDQIQFYDDEAGTPVRRIYFYVNGSWSYITLT